MASAGAGFRVGRPKNASDAEIILPKDGHRKSGCPETKKGADGALGCSSSDQRHLSISAFSRSGQTLLGQIDLVSQNIPVAKADRIFWKSEIGSELLMDLERK